MIICPSCGHENINGADECDDCGSPLVYESNTRPISRVEHSLLKDRVGLREPHAPIALDPDMAVGEVLDLLLEYRIGCVLVVDDGKLVGVFSERDALIKLNTKAAELRWEPVSEFMTRNPETLTPDAKIAFAVHKMDLGGYRHVPLVAEDGHIAGIISVRDILRYISEDLAALERPAEA